MKRCKTGGGVPTWNFLSWARKLGCMAEDEGVERRSTPLRPLTMKEFRRA